MSRVRTVQAQGCFPEVFELMEAGGVSDVLEQRLIDLGLDLL
jgi:hypothetical protein